MGPDRALSDPDFDFEGEAAVFEIEYRVIHGNYDIRHYPFALNAGGLASI